MSKERFTVPIGISLLLIKNNEVLLIRRCNTGWEDGKYSLVGGHVEDNESFADAMTREVREEIGITVNGKDLTVVHLMYTQKNYLDVFMLATHWQGIPTIKELDKIDDLEWFPFSDLPDNMPKMIRAGIEAYQKGIFFSEFT